jgi:hypothetical protein
MENTQQALQEDDARNITWEANHQKILAFINEKMGKWRANPPTITEIANGTGLSRLTIYKHLQEGTSHSAYRQRSELFNMMESDILLRICGSALGGDLKAAKLYLELTGKLQAKAATKENIAGSTNIQINDVTLNQQVVQHLSEEQIKQIEEIIKPVISIYDLQTENPQKS